MMKKVNVRTQIPVVDITHPISGVARGITLPINEILICLHRKAKVEEIVGKELIPLDFTNYDKDHSVKIEVVEEVVVPVVEPVSETEEATMEEAVEETEAVVEPVAEETVTEETTEETVEAVVEPVIEAEKPATNSDRKNRNR